MNILHQDSIKEIKEIKKKTGKDKKISFVSGKFSIVHPGHLRLLRFAAECSDFLVVGIYADRMGDALLPETLRLEGIMATSWVDYAFILHDAPEMFIKKLMPDIVVKGKEHENLLNPELVAVKSYNGRLLFGSGDISFSSIDLLREEFKKLNLSTIVQPKKYRLRHNVSKADLKTQLKKIQQLKVIVVGDTILDEYITCDPVGMSQEDPTIVVTPVMNEKFVGGAGIVAAHSSGLGAESYFFSVTGNDPEADFVKKQLEEYNVKTYLFKDDTRPTTLKKRYRASDKTLLRVNQLRSHYISADIQNKMLQDIISLLDKGIRIVIFSDFNYGCLPQNLVNKIITNCKKRNILMVADSQSSSQIGDVSRFHGASLLTPTEREARLAVRDFNSGLVVLAEALRIKTGAKNIVITLGKEGVLIHTEISEQNKWLNDKIPAMNTTPIDTAGAGDSLLTTSAMMMAVGSDIWKSAYMGSLAAACQIGRLGNIPLSIKELKMELKD